MKRFRLGVDVGTTRVKSAVVDENGNIVSFASYQIRLYIEGNRIEIDPEELWRAVVAVIKQTTSSDFIKENLIGLSLATQGGTLILLDEKNNPIRRAITWMDTRAKEENEELLENYGAEFFYKITGWLPSQACLPLSQLLWLRKKETDTFRKIAKCHFVDSYLLYRLTKNECTDWTNAAITMLSNIREKKWDERLLKIVGISEEQLPLIKPPGTPISSLSETASTELGLPRDTLVFSGGHDQYCSALGAGIERAGEVLLSAGTAWVVLAITDKPYFSSTYEFYPGPHLRENLWGALTSIPYGGASYDWFLKNILMNKISYEEADELIKKAEGETPIFKPFLSQNESKAVFSNLAINHTTGHLLRAIMEGIAQEVKRKIQIMIQEGIEIRSLKMVGGGARSSVWQSIVSQTLRLPVSIPPNLETACLGAALLVNLKKGDEI
ncbi:hypothetical protein H5T87_00805 [bacterium]|nr:hypothetical protein [bacterium]